MGRTGPVRESLETMARTGRLDPATLTGGESSLSAGRVLNPQFVEMLMGFPIGWTACAPLETPSSQRRPNSHSEPSMHDSDNAADLAPLTKGAAANGR
jgi:hypothetical protein